MQTWNIVIICFLDYIIFRKRSLCSYIIVWAAVIIIYYLIRHNVDMYIVSASGCFSMAGFKKVIEEKIKYNKSFIVFQCVQAVCRICQITVLRMR